MEKTRVLAIAKDGIKPESISSISKRKFKACKSYGIDDRFSVDTGLNACFRFKVNQRIARSFLNSLAGKGNTTALQLLRDENMPFNYEDILSTVNEVLCMNADNITLEGTETVVFADNVVVDCFKACSSVMFQQSTKVLKHTSTTAIINECLHSSEYEDGVILEDEITGEPYTQSLLPMVKYDIRVITDYISANYKDTTASELNSLFLARLYGTTFTDFERETGLSHDRVKYLNRLLHKVGLTLGYTVPAYNTPYTEKPVKRHDITVNGKAYNVVSVKPVKKAIVNKWIPCNKRYECKPFHYYKNINFGTVSTDIVQEPAKHIEPLSEIPFKRFSVKVAGIEYDIIK